MTTKMTKQVMQQALKVLCGCLEHPGAADAIALIKAAIAAPEPVRGTDAQILKERELTCWAVEGAMATGFQAGEYPPDEAAWLRVFWNVGRRDAERGAEIAALKAEKLVGSNAGSNALRNDHPLAAGNCTHKVSMAQHCQDCVGSGAQEARARKLYTQPAPSDDLCACEACVPQGNFLSQENMRMILCATCGNKRCPHATDHRNACTGSNDVGQKGSSWESVKPLIAQPVEPVAWRVSFNSGQSWTIYEFDFKPVEGATVKPLYLAPNAAQPVEPATLPVNWAGLIHYPYCWDTAAYPELRDAIHECLAWSWCSTCKPEQPAPAAPYQVTDEDAKQVRKDWVMANGSTLNEDLRIALQSYEARKATA